MEKETGDARRRRQDKGKRRDASLIGRRAFVVNAGRCLVGGSAALMSCSRPVRQRRPNVLMFIVDDLMTQLGPCGSNTASTPNMDRLAQGGIAFDRAYCQQAVCSPSRVSMLTGLRPESTRVYNLTTHFRTTVPAASTLPQVFKMNGYFSQGLSKVFHITFDNPDSLDDSASWSAPSWFPSGRPDVEDEELRQVAQSASESGVKPDEGNKSNPAWLLIGQEGDLHDEQTASKAVDMLKRLKDSLFFLAVGFKRPHLPYFVPQRFWDLYDPSRLPLTSNPFPPKDVPSCAMTNSWELRDYYPIPKEGPLPEGIARQLIHGCHASISFVDAQIGRVLDSLRELGLEEDTIVVLVGDNGFHLGEQGMWCKNTGFEVCTRVPLIVKAPRFAGGKRCNALVELVDIFPSLLELAGIPPVESVEGCSFVPLLSDPDRPWKRAVFSLSIHNVDGIGQVFGESMRTPDTRFTEWRPTQGEFSERELYDLSVEQSERENLAVMDEHREKVETLSRMLREGWKAARPPAK